MKKKFISKILLGAITFSMCASPLISHAAPTSISDTNSQRQELLQEIEVTDSDIQNLMIKMEKINNDLKNKQIEVDDCTKKIEGTTQDLEKKQKLLDERLKNSYTEQVPTELNYLNILFSSNSLTDLVTKANFITKAVGYDKNLVESVKKYKSELEENKEKIQKDLKFLEEGKKEVDEQNKELEAKKESQKLQLNNLNANVNPTSNTNITRNFNLTFSNETMSGNSITDYAAKFLGVPYVWGGTSPSGFDCSGLTQYVYAAQGISIPRVAEDQQKVGKTVTSEEAKPGDLIFFGNPAHHVAMYVGNGYMIHAPHTGDVVRYAPVDLSKVSNIQRIS